MDFYLIGDLVDVYVSDACIGRGRILSITDASRANGRGISIAGVGDGYDPEHLALVDGPLTAAPDAGDQYPTRGSAEDRARAVGRYTAAYMASLEWSTVVSVATAPEPEYRAMYAAERARREKNVRARNLAARPAQPDDGERARIFARAAELTAEDARPSDRCVHGLRRGGFYPCPKCVS